MQSCSHADHLDAPVRTLGQARRDGERLDLDALGHGLGQLVLTRRHLVAGPPVEDRHGPGAKAPCNPCRVYRGVPSPDHHDSFSDIQWVAPLGRLEELQCIHDLMKVLTRYSEGEAEARSDSDEKGIEPCRFELGELDIPPHLSPRLDADAGRLEQTHLGPYHIIRQPALGYGEAEHPPDPLLGLEYRHLVPPEAEIVGCGQARRSGPDHSDLSALLFHLLEAPAHELPGATAHPLIRQDGVGQEPLDPVYRHRLVHAAPAAHRLAGTVAEAPHGGRNGDSLSDQIEGLAVPAGIGEGHVPWNADVGGTAECARSRPVLGNG